MTLLWRKQLAVGDERIDQEHKYLICLINTIELALRTSDDRDLLTTTLDQLGDYTRYHFEREETIMLSIRYSRFDQHKAQHQLLIRELGVIRKRLEDKADSEFSAEECESISALFRHWLIDHIVKEDMQLRTALTGKP